jgi:hypothetical protein
VALDDRIPADHPLRGVRTLVDEVLAVDWLFVFRLRGLRACRART